MGPFLRRAAGLAALIGLAAPAPAAVETAVPRVGLGTGAGSAAAPVALVGVALPRPSVLAPVPPLAAAPWLSAPVSLEAALPALPASFEAAAPAAAASPSPALPAFAGPDAPVPMEESGASAAEPLARAAAAVERARREASALGTFDNPYYVDTNMLVSPSHPAAPAAKRFLDAHPRVLATGQVFAEAYDVDADGIRRGVEHQNTGMAAEEVRALAESRTRQVHDEISGHLKGLVSSQKLVVRSVIHFFGHKDEFIAYREARGKALLFLKKSGVSEADADVLAGVIAESPGRRAGFATMDARLGHTIQQLAASPKRLKEFARALPGYFLPEILIVSPVLPAP